jgi:hypothetical protein
MIRKFFALAVLSALPTGLLVALGAGSAQASTPVTFKGSISCSLVGKIAFKPPLSFAQKTLSTTATFHGVNNHCIGINGTPLTQGGETLTGSKDHFAFTIPVNSGGSCSALASGVAPPITMRVAWTGTSAITPSKLAFSSGTLSASNGLLEYLSGTSAGSFAGSARMAMQATAIKEGNGTILPYSESNALAACSGTGIAALKLSQPNPEPSPFSKNDNLEVGKAF